MARLGIVYNLLLFFFFFTLHAKKASMHFLQNKRIRSVVIFCAIVRQEMHSLIELSLGWIVFREYIAKGSKCNIHHRADNWTPRPHVPVEWKQQRTMVPKPKTVHDATKHVFFFKRSCLSFFCFVFFSWDNCVESLPVDNALWLRFSIFCVS